MHSSLNACANHERGYITVIYFARTIDTSMGALSSKESGAPSLEEYTPRPWPQSSEINAHFFKRLYKKYHAELAQLIPHASEYCTKIVNALPRSKFKMTCMSDQLEIEMAYMRVREAKPRVLFEISAAKGYSTLWLLHALAMNGNGKLYSFDRYNISLPMLPPAFTSNHTLYSFVFGDVRKTLPAVLAATGPPDYAFIDSYHSRAFGLYFQQALLDRMRPGSYVSWHDVYHDKFYADDKTGRDLAVHPSDHPTEEGMTVITWLAFTGRGRRVFTMSSSARTPEHAWACRARKMYIDVTNTARGEMHRLDRTGCGGDSPTIYFELH